jgi:SAM-dependent methyltransferase
LPLLSLQRWRFAGLDFAMRTIGRLSQGIRIGLVDGFDSGPMLDYVYRDRAHGITPLGRKIDRDFLDEPGWRAIRQRRRNLELMLGHAIALVRGAGQPVRIVEIGSGGGRYTLEAVKTHAPDASVLLLDHDPRSVETGRANAAELGMQNVRCEEGDGFDRAALARLAPAPTIALASGLYELFPENAPVRESLAGLAAAVPAGCYLVYTNQPWNTQLEFIARMLTTHRDVRWVMRRRSQAEMDHLVADAGFEKIAMAIDDHGFMAVSLARRIPLPAKAGEDRYGSADKGAVPVMKAASA